MENTDTVSSSVSLPRKNGLAIIGFVLMLAGPATLIFAGMYTSLFGHISGTVAEKIAWVAAILPGIGVLICLISLFWWKNTGQLGCAFLIVTLTMCNPIFYLVYLVICGMVAASLEGRPFLDLSNM